MTVTSLSTVKHMNAASLTGDDCNHNRSMWLPPFCREHIQPTEIGQRWAAWRRRHSPGQRKHDRIRVESWRWRCNNDTSVSECKFTNPPHPRYHQSKHQTTYSRLSLKRENSSSKRASSTISINAGFCNTGEGPRPPPSNSSPSHERKFASELWMSHIVMCAREDRSLKWHRIKLSTLTM